MEEIRISFIFQSFGNMGIWKFLQRTVICNFPAMHFAKETTKNLQLKRRYFHKASLGFPPNNLEGFFFLRGSVKEIRISFLFQNFGTDARLEIWEFGFFSRERNDIFSLC